VRNPQPLLVAGADSARRRALLDDLLDTMPEGTSFEEASTLSEVLERAPMSRIVVLSGGLEDASAKSLMRVLGQRHPTLPIITMDPAGLDDL
jgi:DNA-binding NtrC family response regulator